jgi:TolB-like protein
MKEQKNHVLYTCCTVILLSLMLAVPSWAYEKEINTLSDTMADKISKAGRTTVAVVDFTDLEGNVTQLGRFIAEEFSTALAGAGKGFKVVDRTHLNSIIKEHKLSATGLIDPKTARKLGEIIGVQALITGTLTPFGDNVRIAVKILDTSTAEVIDAVRGNLAKTKAIDELLDKGIASVQTTRKRKTKSTGSKQSQTATSDAFFDDLNMGPKPDWKAASGNWTMANGQYTVTDIIAEKFYMTFLEGKKWENISLSVDITPGYIGNDSWGSWYKANICPKIISTKERICFGMKGKGHKFNEAYWYTLKAGKTTGEHVSRVPIETSDGQAVRVKIEVRQGVFTAYINGAQVNQIYDTTFPIGSIGLVQWYKLWTDQKIRIGFDNIEVTPLAD